MKFASHGVATVSHLMKRRGSIARNAPPDRLNHGFDAALPSRQRAGRVRRKPRQPPRPREAGDPRPRGANARVQKAVYWLAVARQDGQKPEAVLDRALAGKMSGDAAKLTKAALLRNLNIAEKLGCLNAEGLAEMRKGNAPTVRRGPYTGDQLSVDHIIPRSVAPELDNVIANLELMPQRMNAGKRNRVGERQVSLARKFHKAGLLSITGLAAALAASANRR